MKIGIYLFEFIHGKKDVGSSRIRGHWLVKYWKEAEIYQIGKKYDVIIYQKVFFKEHMKYYKGIKILDICDPDWFEAYIHIGEIDKYIDAYIVSSEGLEILLKTLTYKPVYYIPDRHDLEIVKGNKQHKGKAKSVVWFGYANSSDAIRGTVNALIALNLNITYIADNFITVADYGMHQFKQYETFVKFNSKTVYNEIIKHDIVLLPKWGNALYQYKSDNRTTLAWCLGMPVAETREDLERFIEEKERIKEGKYRREYARRNYDIKLSVKQFQEVIQQVQEQKDRI